MRRGKKRINYNLDTVMPLMFVLFIVFYLVSHVSNVEPPKTHIPKPLVDSISKKDSIVDVSGKKVLFIGDSHTVYANGWQHQLCTKTKMTYTNTAVGGKRTDWMLRQLMDNIDTTYDYCFIWGGANDAASQMTIESSISNIQKMVNMCNGFKIKPIVLTGFNPQLCINVANKEAAWSNYPKKYTELQSRIMSDIKHCTIVKNHFVTRKDGDCGDFICHMSASGHRKMANGIINELHLKVY
jgi:hypothetical protein